MTSDDSDPPRLEITSLFCDSNIGRLPPRHAIGQFFWGIASAIIDRPATSSLPGILSGSNGAEQKSRILVVVPKLHAAKAKAVVHHIGAGKTVAFAAEKV